MHTAAARLQADNAVDEGPVIIGQHPLIEQIARVIRKVAATDATVLILGESGTGKDLIARSIHAQSPRRDAAFVPVNCGAIPGDLLESEMFGHERGAFTGAGTGRAGLLQLAHGGTIFLDEIGEMSPHLQVKLLRVLQDGVVRPVGGDRTVTVDVRVVAASNKDLAAEVAAGRVREDLYYRLNVIPLTMPALRERRSDVPFLVRYFVEVHNRRRCGQPLSVSDQAMVHLWEYDWPGNVRELENLMQRLAVLAEGPVIGVDDLPPAIRAITTPSQPARLRLTPHGFDLQATVEEFEHNIIAEAMRRTNGNKQAAARLLGVKRTTLVAKLRRRSLPEAAASA